jgi:CHAT domain-containing protein
MEGQPMFHPGDQQQIMRLSEIRSRLLTIMPRATFGLADVALIKELKHILEDLNLLFNALSPQHPACEPTEVQNTMAETMIHLAKAYDALHNSEQASLWYERAASLFEIISQPELARQCRDFIKRLHFYTHGTFDTEFLRLQELLSEQPQGSLPYIKTLIELGNLYKDADDLFEAEKVYRQAENILEPIEPAPLDKSAVPLEQLLLYCQDIEFLYDLRYHLSSNMIYLYRGRSSEQARKYFQWAHQNESARDEYRYSITRRIIDILLADLSETITALGQGIRTSTRLDSLQEGLRALAATNGSLPPSISRDKLLQDLQTLLMNVKIQRPVQDVIHLLRSHVQQIQAFIDAIYQKQAMQQRADLMHLLETQLSFDVLRQEIQAFTAQSSQQQMHLTEKLMQRTHALQDESQHLNLLEGVTTALALRAELLMDLRDYDEAIAVLMEARRLLGDHWQHDRGVAILALQAEANAYKDDWKTVANICQQGIELVEHYRYNVTGQYLQSTYLISRIRLYSLGIRAAYELKNHALMLQWADLSKCRSILRYQQRTLVPSQDLQTTEREFQKVCEQLHRVSTDSVFEQELRQKRRTLWDLLLIQRYHEQTGKDFPVFSLQRLQATLADDEAVIYYYWLDEHALLITTINRQHIIAELRAIDREQRKELEQIAQFVLAVSDIEREGGRLQKITEFSSLLLPQSGMALLEHKRRLLISPHRMLHAIPFHALLLGADFLIQRFAVSYVPNLTTLLLSYLPSIKPDVLALGIREYNIPNEQVEDLKDAESEAEEIQNIYNREENPGMVLLLKGSEARREQLQALEAERRLELFTCLHFATHGKNIISDTPMESCLLLQNTLLDGLEIANWKLNAETVVLSACCSGQRAIAGRGRTELPGDDLLGLQAAFFCAGAKRLLCSLWPVDSTIAHKMLVLFHQYIVRGHLPEIALQTAIKDYLANARVRSRKLCYWSPFFLSVMVRPELTTISTPGGTTNDTSYKP